MSLYKKLAENSLVFAIGNLGSKIIVLLLVPLYTHYLSTEQYGTIDMITTFISLILPIVSLSIFDGTLRFTTKSKYNNTDILSSSLLILLLGNLLFLILSPVLKRITILQGYIMLLYIIMLLQGLNQVLSQFAKGIGKTKVFALNGIINTLVIVIFNIILLIYINMGIYGYLISIAASYFVCNLYLIIYMRIWNYIKIKEYNYTLIREMLSYTIPLIPNSLMWWIMNLSDRYIISIFLGVSANGLYAVANKIPSILNVIYSIFSQAWQLSAIQESESKNKSEFYTNVFEFFSIVMFIGSSLIMMIIKPMFESVFGAEYYDAWKTVPFLLLSIVFTSFSSFLGSNYIAMKKTKGIFRTSFLGAVANIVLNIILIPHYGINGAAIATMISFFIVWILRSYETRNFVEIKIKKINFAITLGLLFTQIIFMLNTNYLYLQLILFLGIIINNIGILKKLVKMLFNKI